MINFKQKIIGHPLTGRDASIQQVLRDLASQEGCDGEPYDECIEAARYIDELEYKLRLMNEREDGLSGHFIGLDRAIYSCDLDKIVFYSDNILDFNSNITEGEEKDTKASKAYNLLKSMDIYYDEDLKLWYKKGFL